MALGVARGRRFWAAAVSAPTVSFIVFDETTSEPVASWMRSIERTMSALFSFCCPVAPAIACAWRATSPMASTM